MDRTKKYLITAFISVLIIVALISFLGMILLGNKPTILQGQIEATEIRISGKLPGRIDTFLVKEGQNVSAGDTLVIINSPEARAKYEQVNALENVAKYQNQKLMKVLAAKLSKRCSKYGARLNRICNWQKRLMTVF